MVTPNYRAAGASMASNRRTFLQFAGLAPAAAATAGLAASKDTPAVVTVSLTRTAFQACVGDEFTFESGPHDRFAAKLVRVCQLQAGGKPIEAEGVFSLEFEPAKPGSLAQDTYAVTHPRFGRL